MFDLVRKQEYQDKLSVSSEISKKHGNCTYGFKLADFDFNKPLNFSKLGFTGWVFKDGHRTKDNMIGMTNLGYIDIDLPRVPAGDSYNGKILTPDDIIKALSSAGKAFYLSRSKSGTPGKYRIIYKRPFTMENGELISTGVILNTFKHAGEVCVRINRNEADAFLEILPEAEPFIDKTSFDYHMHSKNLGGFLYSQDGDCLMSGKEYDLDKLLEVDNSTQDRIDYQTSIEGSFDTDNNLCYFKLVRAAKDQVFTRGGNEIKGDSEYYRWVGGSTLPINDSGGADKIHILQLFDNRKYWIDDSKIGGIPKNKHLGRDAFMQFKSFGIQVFNNKESITFWSAGVHHTNIGYKLIITFNILDEVWVEDSSEFNHIRTDDGDFWADSKSMTIYRTVRELKERGVVEQERPVCSRKIHTGTTHKQAETILSFQKIEQNIKQEAPDMGAPKLGTKYKDVVLEESDFFYRKPKKWINGRWRWR